jgi:hypothetical protein
MLILVFLKWFFEKMEEGAGRSTQRVLSWHEKSLEYLDGTVEEMEMVMFD